MNDKVIQEILEEKAQNPNTRKLYQATYRKMERFEQEIGRNFDEDPEALLFEYIENPKHKYNDLVELNNRLPQIKCYLRAVGGNEAILKLTGKDFDISRSMRAVLVESLDEIYQRSYLCYRPDNGDAIFPLVSMAWMGLSGPEALRVADSAIDLKNKKIITDTQLIFDVMPNHMVHILSEYRAAEQSHKDNNGQTKLPDRIGRFIYKTSHPGSSSSGKPLSTSTVGDLFNRVRKAYNQTHDLQTYTTYGDVMKSAQYFKARQMELSGVDLMDGNNDVFLQSIFRTNRVEPGYLRHNYQMYKKAFGLK